MNIQIFGTLKCQENQKGSEVFQREGHTVSNSSTFRKMAE
jgi:hypothetical protein